MEISAENDNDVLNSIRGIPVSLPPGSPEFLAAIVNGPSETRIVVVQLSTGSALLLPQIEPAPEDLAWSPDGNQIVIAAGERLVLFRGPQRTTEVLLDDLSTVGETRFAYDFFNGRLAVGGRDRLSILAGASYQQEFSHQYPSGTVFEDMAWTHDGQQLVLLLRDPDSGERKLLWVELATGAVTGRDADGVTLLLAGTATDTVVTAAYGDTRIGTALKLERMSESGQWLRNADEEEAGEYVVSFNAASKYGLAYLGTEDLGDPVGWRLLPSGDAPAVPWLTEFGLAHEIAFDPDGNYAVFVDHSPTEGSGAPGGDIYVVRSGSNESRLVLRCDAESHTFAVPQLRPAPSR